MVDCSFCLGRGWRLEGVAHVDWPVPCAVCKGRTREPEYKTPERGFASLAALATFVGLDPKDLYKVRRLEAGPTIGTRVLNAFASRLPEAFVSS